MRPNLSLESITGALAVLGTGVIMAACGGDTKPAVNANEVSNATPAAAEGAGHCGAGKDHKAGEASCSAEKKAATDAVKPADTAAAPATPAAATPADAKGVAPAATGTATTKKPGAPATPAAATPKKGGSSCGAGTCSAKK